LGIVGVGWIEVVLAFPVVGKAVAIGVDDVAGDGG